MTTIVYLGDDKTVSVADPDMTILDTSIAHKIPHFRECGGNGRCTTCRVRICDGIYNVLPRTEREAEVAEPRRWDKFTRLACQTRVRGDVVLERLVTSPVDVSRVQLEEASLTLPEERMLTVLFCDIREFTPFVEQNLAYDVVHILNRFFTAVGESILINNGVIYQYVGDEITGLFGVGGDPIGKSCLDAIRAGLGIIESLSALNEHLEQGFGLTLDVGIGAHCGPLIAGLMGHPGHRQFTAVGDAMNTTSRIEAANKALGTQFLVSEALFDRVTPALVEGRRTQAVLRGKPGPFNLVEVVGFAAPDTALLVQSTIGLLLQHQEHFASAFYERMFSISPGLKALFRGDMERQGRMLAHTIQFLVHAMSRPEIMTLGLRDLGQRHRGYGVIAEHYPVFSRAFLETAGAILGEKFTPQVESAWAETIDMIIEAMQTSNVES